MPRRSRLAIPAVFALIFTLSPAYTAGDSARLPTWKPDPKIVAGLGPAIVIDGAAFQIPGTVRLAESQVKDGAHIFHWRGDPEDDGIRSMYMVLVIPIDALSDSDKNDPGLTATNFVRVLQHATANMISDPDYSDIQHGMVAGQEFSKEYFKGYNHRWLREIHGFFYSAITKRAIFIFQVWDQEPLSKYSLPVYEGAVLTFHPTDQQDTPMPDNLIDPDDIKVQQDQSD